MCLICQQRTKQGCSLLQFCRGYPLFAARCFQFQEVAQLQTCPTRSWIRQGKALSAIQAFLLKFLLLTLIYTRKLQAPSDVELQNSQLNTKASPGQPGQAELQPG